MHKSDTSKQISGAAIRMFIYMLLVTAVVMLFTKEAELRSGPDLYSENSWTEYLEVTFLFITAVILIAVGRIDTNEKPLTTLMAGMTTIAFIREFDFFLDAHVFDGAWQLLASLTAVFTAVLVFRWRHTLTPSILSFINRPSFGIFLSSFLTIFIFSRLFGRKVLWYSIMGTDGFIRAVKNGAEEGTELFGYTLMMIAAMELYREIHARKKHTRI